MADKRKGAKQTAWQIQAASSSLLLETKPDLWDSGKKSGAESLDISYSGKSLFSRMAVYWRVRVWDLKGKESPWSSTAIFEMGFLSKSDWQADWIAATPPNSGEPSPCFRKMFTVTKTPVKARLYVTAHGVFETHINGRRVGDDYLTPGWTDYNKRLYYLVYDVTEHIQEGINIASAMLGNGWFAGRLGWGDQKHYYGERPSLLYQLEITYSDGFRELVCSGNGWKSKYGPIISSDIYDGETYDSRLAIKGWMEAGFNDSNWTPVELLKRSEALLVSKPNLPIRRQETLPALSISEPSPNIYIFDFGQNMVGWACVRIKGLMEGEFVKLRFGEMLNSDGTLYTANLRSAKATDIYIGDGSSDEVWEPRFTFHGFRYVELSGAAAKPVLTDVYGIVLHSEMEPIGSFECSDPAVNRLQKNILWGLKSNFLDVPTDCPQRDERLGWTGDAQVFIRTASFNRSVASFFEKWCADIRDAQFDTGVIPHVVPDVLRSKDTNIYDHGNGCAAWADAVVICPWMIYLCYADKKILEDNYDAMRHFVDWRERTAKEFIHSHSCFGDWLAIDLIHNNPGKTTTPRDLISTAYFARTAEIVANVAQIIGKKSDAQKYLVLHKKVKKAFVKEFVSVTGRIVGDTQTSYLLALGFNLLPANTRKYATKRLVDDIEKRGWHLSTGFVGTPLLAPVLSSIGRTDVAYRLLLQTTYPSWLYTVAQGATTMWERWNSWTKETSFGDVSMNSFNHYAYGAIGEWLYATVAGIDFDVNKPGYKHIILRPEPGGTLTSAKAELITRYGKVISAWKIDGKKIYYQFVIPPNTTATIVLKGKRPVFKEAGSYTIIVSR